MLRFKRGLDVDYVNNPARRRPLFAGSGEYRAIVESERGQLLLPTRELSFRAALAAEHIDHVPGPLVVLVNRPFVVVTVVEVAGAVIIEAVVIETRNHKQRALGAVAAKVSLSFHGKYRRPEMLARLALESRTVAMNKEFIPFDFEVDPVSSPTPHSGVDLPGGAVSDLYFALLKIIGAA